MMLCCVGCLKLHLNPEGSILPHQLPTPIPVDSVTALSDRVKNDAQIFGKKALSL